MRNRITALVLSSALLVGPSVLAQPTDDARFAADTRDYLQRLETVGFAGVVLVARNGVPLVAEGFGLADRERGIPWTPATISSTGSITKQFTATAILRLAEEGKLRVEDAMAKYLDGVPDDKKSITIHQLLTHSSGIVDLDEAGDWDPIGREEFVRRIFAQPLAFAPGKGYEYSNAGYSLLGAIIETLTGKSYETFVRERLFVPLGIYETGYVLAPWGEGRMAQGYRDRERWGTVLGRPMAADGPYWVLRANGGIHTNAWDMLRWARALLDGRALTEASRRLLWEPHVREGADADTFYGYGWSVQEHGGMKVVTHNGSNGIFYADLAIVPQADVVVYLMTNVFSGNRYLRTLLEQIGLRLMTGRAYPDVPRLAAADPKALAMLAGTWRFEGGGRIRARAEGDALAVEPADAAAFGRLFSDRRQSETERKLGDERGQRLVEALRAAGRRDFAPLQRLYGDAATLERLSSSWSSRIDDFVERNGAFRDVTAVGAAMRGDEQFLLMRIHGERGTQDLTFVWRAEPEGRLLGMSLSGIQPVLRFQAEAGGGWAAFDRSTGEILRLRNEGQRIVIGGGENAVAAQRE